MRFKTCGATPVPYYPKSSTTAAFLLYADGPAPLLQKTAGMAGISEALCRRDFVWLSLEGRSRTSGPTNYAGLTKTYLFTLGVHSLPQSLLQPGGCITSWEVTGWLIHALAEFGGKTPSFLHHVAPMQYPAIHCTGEERGEFGPNFADSRG